jgi:hypothetical protein
MFVVPEKYIKSVSRELVDTDIRILRFHRRNYIQPFPCMIPPTIDDELCARIDCHRRVYSLLQKGFSYCSYDCMCKDIEIREQYLCKKCWIFAVADYNVPQPCKRINLCNRCLSSSPCFCSQCRHCIPIHVMRALTPEVYYRDRKQPLIELRTSM